MKVRKGREQIGGYQGIPVVIDWNDLLHSGGKLGLKAELDAFIGRISLFGGIALIVVGLLLMIAGSNMTLDGLLVPSTFSALLPWFGALLVLYSTFINRNHDEFNFTLEEHELTQLNNSVKHRRLKDIEVESYISYSILVDIDYFYHQDSANFISNFTTKLFEYEEVQAILLRWGVNIELFRQAVSQHLLQINTSFDTHFRGLFFSVFSKAIELETEKIGPLIFLFIFAEHLWPEVLLKFNVTKEEVSAVQLWLKTENRKLRYTKKWRQKSVFRPLSSVNRAYTSRYSPTLEEFGEDLTRHAASGEFELTMGRDEQMKDIIKNLQKPNGATVLLEGEPGVGKTQFLKHLAVHMVVEDVPVGLRDKRLVAFDFTRAFARHQTLEGLKMMLQTLLEEVVATGDVILVLDELEQLLNIRSDFEAEVVSILENGIRSNKLKVIATTTSDGYTRYIEPIKGLAAIFERVKLDEPSSLVALQILIDESNELEGKYGIKIQVNALKQIVALAPQYAYERVMPDKAIRLLEESMIEAQQEGAKFLTEDIVSAVVSRKVGVSVGKLSRQESDLLMKLEDELHKRVVGQDTAIKAVASALRRARAGFSKATRPIAAFLFFGPTGVGKTEVAKTLAASYYGDEKLMIRIDMSEYQEEKNLGRLIGQMEGNKFTGGYLTEAVRSKPYSLVLLDEIEKANPKVLDLFLQVIDEGYLTDGAGRKVSFQNVIVIATSNAGSRQIAEMLGKGMRYQEINQRIQPILRSIFRVEFLNRFDQVIMFKPLAKLEVQQIAGRMLIKVANGLMEKGIKLEYTDTVLQELAELGYSPVYGARELRRVIQEQVENKVAELIVSGRLKSGGGVRMEGVGRVILVD